MERRDSGSWQSRQSKSRQRTAFIGSHGEELVPGPTAGTATGRRGMQRTRSKDRISNSKLERRHSWNRSAGDPGADVAADHAVVPETCSK